MGVEVLDGLPVMPVDYAVVSAFRVAAFSGVEGGGRVELDLGAPGARAWLVADPLPLMEDVDYSNALFHLFMGGLRGVRDFGLEDVRQRVRVLREERAKRFDGSGLYLVVRVEGRTQSIATRSSQVCTDAVFSIEAVDTGVLRSAAKAFVSRAVAAVSMASGANSGNPVRFDDGVVLKLPDGKWLCSPTVRGMGATVTVSRPLREVDASAIAKQAALLLANKLFDTPVRLVADALLRAGDRLECFLMAWAALEMVVKKATSGVESGEWVERVHPASHAEAKKFHEDWVAAEYKTYSLAAKVRVFGWLYGVPTEAVERIQALKVKVREPLYHEAKFDETALPVEETLRLANALLIAAVAKG